MARAKVPVRWSQGFNPRPIFSLPCPRPVGVASRADLLVLTCRQDHADPPPADLAQRLADCAPRGMRFGQVAALTGRRTPGPVRAAYRTELDAGRRPAVVEAVSRLAERDSWPVRREAPPKGRRSRSKAVTLDARRLLADLAVAPDGLRFVLVPDQSRWIRPAEVLALVGLDPRGDLARTVRTEVGYDPPIDPVAH
jgi:radical SAM-linked protein